MESRTLEELCHRLSSVILSYGGILFTGAHHTAARVFYCLDNEIEPKYGVFSELSRLRNGYYINLSHSYPQTVEADLNAFCLLHGMTQPMQKDLITVFSFEYEAVGSEVFMHYINRAKGYLGTDSQTPFLLKELIKTYGNEKEND